MSTTRRPSDSPYADAVNLMAGVIDNLEADPVRGEGMVQGLRMGLRLGIRLAGEDARAAVQMHQELEVDQSERLGKPVELVRVDEARLLSALRALVKDLQERGAQP